MEENSPQLYQDATGSELVDNPQETPQSDSASLHESKSASVPNLTGIESSVDFDMMRSNVSSTEQKDPSESRQMQRPFTKKGTICRALTLKENFDILQEVFAELEIEDPPIRDEAMRGFLESVYFQATTHKQTARVERRSPLTILDKPTELTDDPAMDNIPLRGKLITMIFTTSSILMIFLQTLCANKTKTGYFHVSFADNPMLGPDPQTLFDLGGLNVNAVRNSGEVFRVFWAMWLHVGWFHLALNALTQMQYFIILEPDWGACRSFATFWIAGISGAAVSAVANPCATTVGSSGGLYGLMGAMFSYCFEYWSTIPHPRRIIVFTAIVVVISFMTGFTASTDNWAHLGGFFGGLFFSLLTVKNFDEIRCRLTQREKYVVNQTAQKSVLRLRRKLREVPPKVQGDPKKKKPTFLQNIYNSMKTYRCSRSEFLVRWFSLVLLITLLTVCFLLIFVQPKYQPIGQVTFSGVIPCCCCYNPSAVREWLCLSCGTELKSLSSTWGDYCKLPLSRKANFGLKSSLSDQSLFKAVGLKNLNLGKLMRQTKQLDDSLSVKVKAPDALDIQINMEEIERFDNSDLGLASLANNQSGFYQLFDIQLDQNEVNWLEGSITKQKNLDNFLKDLLTYIRNGNEKSQKASKETVLGMVDRESGNPEVVSQNSRRD